MSNINHEINHKIIADRLTLSRLRSYFDATNGDTEAAINLYDWNTRVGAALYEDLSRLEVVFRNAVDDALTRYGSTRGWQNVWYQRTQLFRGRHASRTRVDIDTACRRATRQGRYKESHGKVIAELNFGFWRYLCEPPYLTSLWVPAIASAFALHPSASNPRQVRSDVADRMQRLHFLRNRIAHHEPIHRRNLTRDHTHLLDIASWICTDTHTWIATKSQTLKTISAQPQPRRESHI